MGGRCMEMNMVASGYHWLKQSRWLNWRTQSMYWMPNLQEIYEGQSSEARPKFQQRQGSSKGSRCVYICFKCICSIVIVVHISTIDWLLLPSYALLLYSNWQLIWDWMTYRRFSICFKWMSLGKMSPPGGPVWFGDGSGDPKRCQPLPTSRIRGRSQSGGWWETSRKWDQKWLTKSISMCFLCLMSMFSNQCTIAGLHACIIRNISNFWCPLYSELGQGY